MVIQNFALDTFWATVIKYWKVYIFAEFFSMSSSPGKQRLAFGLKINS